MVITYGRVKMLVIDESMHADISGKVKNILSEFFIVVISVYGQKQCGGDEVRSHPKTHPKTHPKSSGEIEA